MKTIVQRKWSFVRPSRPAVWRWAEALFFVLVSHALLLLLIGVKTEGGKSINRASAGATLLSGHGFSSADTARMRRWLSLHDPSPIAEPGHSAGASRILPDVLHHGVAMEQASASSRIAPAQRKMPRNLPLEPLAPVSVMPMEKVREPAPFLAQILDSSGRERQIPLAVDHETAGVSGPTVLRIVRQQETVLAVTERSCGIPALDALAQGGILRALPEAPDGERFTVNWPAERGGAR